MQLRLQAAALVLHVAWEHTVLAVTELEQLALMENVCALTIQRGTNAPVFVSKCRVTCTERKQL